MSDMFTYTTGAGDTIVLPSFTQIPFGVIRTLRSEPEAEQIFALVEKVTDEKSLAVMDTLPMDEIEAMFTAWQASAKVTVGESSASADS